ncbi:MAG: NAD-dependent epimerase/dehydratase family protein [Planctomycetes bacterium]|nr:NAD-dependent epimerase/dehydratase family protein [Planctomycetota bacterium]
MMDYSAYNGFFEGKTALVTGGAGFIGSHLTQHLAALRCKVRVLDDFSTGRASNLLNIDAESIEGSILDDNLLQEVSDGCDFVFHLAAFVSVPKSIEEPQECYNTNILGTEKVVQAANDAKCRRLVFTSSAACYGSHPKLPSSERDQVSLESPYAESKFAGEQLVAKISAIDGVSLRYFNVFGQRQDPNSQYAAVVSAFKNAIQQNRSPIIYGDGTQTRDFTAVENVVHANLLAAYHPEPLCGAVFNVGMGFAMSLNTLVRTMANDEDVQVTYHRARNGDVQHSQADIGAISDVLGYSPVVDTVPALRLLLNPAEL